MDALYKFRQLNEAAKLINEGNIQGFKIIDELIEMETNKLAAMQLEKLNKHLKTQIPINHENK